MSKTSNELIQFETGQHFSPIGKLVTINVKSKLTEEKIAKLVEEDKEDGKKMRMIQDKVMENLANDEIRTRYEEEMKTLLAKARRNSKKRIYVKSKEIKFRVVGYTAETTVLEPCDQRNNNALMSLGY